MSQTQTHSICFFFHPLKLKLSSLKVTKKLNLIYLQFSPNEVLRDLFGLKLFKTLVLTSPRQKSSLTIN